jgi:aryl-alcohol dehydrogenase-like predicted oxidoreductase
MELRKLGHSNLRISALGLGTFAFGGSEYWGDQSQKDVDEAVHRAVDLGVNYFDAAESYSDGRAEDSLGKAIQDIPRDKLVIGTKISPSNVQPATMIKHLEASLQRLGIDYVDIYMVHWPIQPHSLRQSTDDESLINNPPAAVAVFEALGKLQKQGKTRHVGVSNFGVGRLKEAQTAGVEIVANELPYSLLTRAIEFEILPHCHDFGVGVIAYMTFVQGLLTDAFATLDDVPTWKRRTRHFDCRKSEKARHGQHGVEAETHATIEEIRSVARDIDLTMPQLALKWALANDAIGCVLVGARNAVELEDNVWSSSQPLSPEIVNRLDEITKPLMDKMGPSFDYYESAGNDRTV